MAKPAKKQTETQADESKIEHIPVMKLLEWSGNARKTAPDEAALDALTASIARHGLINPLIVKPATGRKEQHFHVVAGAQRLKAIWRNIESKTLPKDYMVACTVLPADADAEEISLAENAVRADMHPADEFEAFRDLVEKGKSIEDVAAAFGVTPKVVERRLKLARVSPRVIDIFREGKINLEMVMAFAIVDDHELQESLIPGITYKDADDIREALTENDTPVTDKRVKFVGLKAYEKAGGTVKRDLFSDDEKDGYVEDTALLNRLVTEKGEKAVAKLIKEGWKWAEFQEAFGYEVRNKYKRIYGTGGEYSADQKATAGSVVTISHDGKAEIHYGLVDPEDMPKAKGKKAKAEAVSGTEEEATPTLPAALIEILTAHKSAALQAELLDKPVKALAMVTYTFAVQIFGSAESCLRFDVVDHSLSSATEGSKAFIKMENQRAEWEKELTDDPDKIWKWCMTQDETNLTALLTFCAACTVDAVQRKSGWDKGYRIPNAELLAQELDLDMSKWFKPTAENYFGKISKAQILEDIKEIGQSELLDAAKTSKADAAEFAERQAEKSIWVPEILRTAD